jgi:hypothetical protein
MPSPAAAVYPLSGRKLSAAVQTLTIGATNLASACDYLDALRAFGPSLVLAEDGHYRVRINLDSSDRGIFEVLDSLEDHVSDRTSGPARLELDGYLLNVPNAV